MGIGHLSSRKKGKDKIFPIYSASQKQAIRGHPEAQIRTGCPRIIHKKKEGNLIFHLYLLPRRVVEKKKSLGGTDPDAKTSPIPGKKGRKGGGGERDIKLPFYFFTGKSGG